MAAAASFLSEHYHAPVMLFALLLGMSMNFLSGEGGCKPGIDFTGRQVLRIGVALLGTRITLAQIAALGWHPAALIILSVKLKGLTTVGIKPIILMVGETAFLAGLVLLLLHWNAWKIRVFYMLLTTSASR